MIGEGGIWGASGEEFWIGSHIFCISIRGATMLVFSYSENGCKQGLFLKRIHARVFLGTDARNQKGHLNGCTHRTLGQRMHARYGVNPGCAQTTSWATSLNRKFRSALRSILMTQMKMMFESRVFIEN